jgi:hypothetical protein
MTSISAASSSNSLTPLQKLQQELQAEVTSGKISTGDQDALSSALTDIDSSIQAGRSSDTSTSAKASPGDLKSKVDDLISGEVSSGKLTSDQASELKDVFKAAFAGGPGGAGKSHGAGGPPPSDSASDTDSTDSTTATSPADLLKQLLASLQESLSASSSTSYSASGTSANASSSSASFSALLIDYQT